jgi:hypothetical protein
LPGNFDLHQEAEPPSDQNLPRRRRQVLKRTTEFADFHEFCPVENSSKYPNVPERCPFEELRQLDHDANRQRDRFLKPVDFERFRNVARRLCDYWLELNELPQVN